MRKVGAVSPRPFLFAMRASTQLRPMSVYVCLARAARRAIESDAGALQKTGLLDRIARQSFPAIAKGAVYLFQDRAAFVVLRRSSSRLHDSTADAVSERRAISGFGFPRQGAETGKTFNEDTLNRQTEASASPAALS
jgi:hypothetical protein